MIRFQNAYVGYPDLTGLHGFPINSALALNDPRVRDYPRCDPSVIHVSGVPTGFSRVAAKTLSEFNPENRPVTTDTILVVGGQQVGLMTGPLYTFLKAVTCIHLARYLSDRWKRDVRPAFWCATEDHDILEVNRFSLIGNEFVVPQAYELERGRMPPVGHVALTTVKDHIISFLRESLTETEYTPRILDFINTLDFSTYSTQFIQLMRYIFRAHDLLLIDPFQIRHLSAPWLSMVVERWPYIEHAFSDGSRMLKERGYEAPLAGIRIFELAQGNRIPLDLSSLGTRLSTGTVSLLELAEIIREEPERFSPGAALRAVCQDCVFPVAATVGGPAELLYLWQILPLYQVLGVVHSTRFPRITATFLSPSLVRAAQKVGLAWDKIFDAADLVVNSLPMEDDPGTKLIDERGTDLLRAVDSLQRSDNPRWLRSARKSISSGIERIVSQLREEQMTRQGLDRNRIRKIMDAIFPGGRMQERATNIFYFLNLYGPGFVAESIETLDPWRDAHHIVRVVPVRDE